MKVYSSAPEGNEMADLEPALYLNLSIEQINKYSSWLEQSNDVCQPLLVHLDIFMTLADKYPNTATLLVDGLDRPQLRSVFNDWFNRVSSKLPSKFRDGINDSAQALFDRLDAIEEF